MRLRIALLATLATVGVGAACTSAADERKAQGEQLPIAALVNGDPIYVAEVDATVAAMLRGHQIDPSTIDSTRAATLREIINRRLVEEALQKGGNFIDEQEIEKGIDAAKTAAAAQKMTLEQYLARRRVTLATLRHELAWKVGWEKYLEVNLSDALEGYFKLHHKDLDGTQIRASHILLRPGKFSESPRQLAGKAEEIRAEIESGKITFEQAAEKYSSGPSRSRGGDLGYFPRYNVMNEEFAKAAFALEKDEISQPVVSPFGTHLIRVTDIKPGTRQWTEAVDQIKRAASADMFERLAKQQRETAKIEFTGAVPYFKGDTEEIVLPAKK